ncbi:hypothetical protein E2562_029201 [Oryza meyeriana var. granulata]|uniref:Uncharacterized protein n=1 Tax=Oryza meyeriana var. granulata TaxID=110450 RepID=A0A6G1E3T8_9ORYZ|nr:hypothetical protein E2562_029201 [Oryza meyeriana var. granulata]
MPSGSRRSMTLGSLCAVPNVVSYLEHSSQSTPLAPSLSSSARYGLAGAGLECGTCGGGDWCGGTTMVRQRGRGGGAMVAGAMERQRRRHDGAG